MRRLVALALLTGAVFAPRVSHAQFDLVHLYQDKVKGFEAIYYLEKDDRWARDRRIFEAFGTTNFLDRDEETGLGDAMLHWNAGLLVNIKPSDSNVQYTFFSMANQMRFLVHDVTEMLHGGRITAAEMLEVTVGGYWLLENARESFSNGRASMFLEVNLPFLGTRSSYVLGQNLRANDEVERDPLLRFDLRWNYDRLSWLDDVEVKMLRYNLSDEDNLLGSIAFTRLGAPAFRFLSGEALWSFSENRLAAVMGGLDFLFQFSRDFNSSRRGHFGTSIGLQFLGTYASPLGYRRFRPRVSLLGSDAGVPGFKAQAVFQIPAKWLWTALLVFTSAAGAAMAEMQGDQRAKEDLIRGGAAILQSTIERPKDELFTRFTVAYAYNDPTVLEMFPGQASQHRLLVTLGVMY